jgi:cell fate (sporulation/competence/biofilm development) regulator YmcA (YheA/YmcA/DUF963 family)
MNMVDILSIPEYVEFFQQAETTIRKGLRWNEEK